MPVQTFKDNLMTALHTAVGYFNAGSDPNEAVTKSAAQHDFNADQTQRLVETFNTARTIYHYKSAADRTVPFSLADSSVVIPALFSEPKKAEAPAVHNHDYSDYGKPEADYRDGLEIKSAAGVRDIDIPEPRTFQDRSLDTLAYQAQEQIRVHRKLAEASRDEARVAGVYASKIMAKLSGDLSRGYAEACQEKFNRLVGGYSKFASAAAKEQWSPVVDNLMTHMPEWMRKGAESVQDEGVFDDRDLTEVVGQLKEAKQWMETESEMLAVAGEMDKIADEYERQWTEAIAPVLPQKIAREKTLSDFINPRLLKAAGWKQTESYKTPDLFTGQEVTVNRSYEPDDSGSKLLLDALKEPTSGMIGKGVDSALRGVLQVPTKKENEQLSERLKNVQRQIMLEDLMSNDPVLSEESPETVANAYTAVANLAPELSTNKEVVRAILRQAVHSVAIGPYEAENWTKLEQNIRNIAGKADLKGRPMEAVKR